MIVKGPDRILKTNGKTIIIQTKESLLWFRYLNFQSAYAIKKMSEPKKKVNITTFYSKIK